MRHGMKSSTDVLVIGAGPVGLLLAMELCREGADVLLVDQMVRRSYFCKALGVTARTLEIFEDLELVQDAIDAGVWLTGVTVFNDGELVQKMEIPMEGLPYGPLSLAQFDTERLLENGLHRHGGTVEYGWRLTDFAEQADGVVAQLQSIDGQSREIHCTGWWDATGLTAGSGIC